jgi:hypothetical protein
MPLVLDPARLPEKILAQLVGDLHRDLEETLDLVRNPRGEVLDATSLRSAEELLESALAVLDAPGPRTAADWGREANLAYSAMVASIDLVKSHTAVPRVPAPRPRSTT